MRTPAVIVFDMGKVLLHFDPMLCISPYVEDPSDREEIARVAFASEEWKMLDEGTITDEEALACWNSRLPERMRAPLEKVFANWHRYLPEIDGMKDLVRDLRNAGYPVYLLSNVSLRFAKLKAYFPALSYMNGYVTSAEERICKPDRRIYEILLTRFGLAAADCLFVDDLPANVAGAKAVGMQGYVFDGDAQKLRQWLTDAGMRF